MVITVWTAIRERMVSKEENWRPRWKLMVEMAIYPRQQSESLTKLNIFLCNSLELEFCDYISDVFSQLNVFLLLVEVSNSNYKTSSLFDYRRWQKKTTFLSAHKMYSFERWSRVIGSGMKIYFCTFCLNTYCFWNKTSKPLYFYLFSPPVHIVHN